MVIRTRRVRPAHPPLLFHGCSFRPNLLPHSRPRHAAGGDSLAGHFIPVAGAAGGGDHRGADRACRVGALPGFASGHWAVRLRFLVSSTWNPVTDRFWRVAVHLTGRCSFIGHCPTSRFPSGSQPALSRLAELLRYGIRPAGHDGRRDAVRQSECILVLGDFVLIPWLRDDVFVWAE